MEKLKQQKDRPNLSIIDNLSDLTKQFPQRLQKYLLATIAEWIKGNREYPKVDCALEALYSDYSQLAKGTAKKIRPRVFAVSILKEYLLPRTFSCH